MENNIIKEDYKYLSTLIILFFTILFANNAVVYKLVEISSYKVSAASLIYPITYLITGIIAEVYGYKTAKKLIWQSVVMNIVFSGLISALILLPSPKEWVFQSSFLIVYNDITLNSIVHGITAPLSYFINAYLISKWKVYFAGKYFGVRSIASSIIGEFIFSLIMVPFVWYGNKLNFILPLILITFSTKIIWAVLGSYLAVIAVDYLKKSEKVDIYDNGIIFNPFKI